MKEMKKVAKTMFNEITNLGKEGAKLAGSAEAAELMVVTFHKILRQAKPAWADFLSGMSEQAQHVQALALSVVLKFACSVWPKMPYAKKAKKLADYAITFESAKLLKPLFGQVSEFVKALVESGEHLVASSEKGE